MVLTDEERKAKGREYYQKNKEKYRNYNQRPEVIDRRNRLRRERELQNPEIRTKRLELYWKNPEKYRATSREYAKKNEKNRRIYAKKWRQNNQEWIENYKKEHRKEYNQKNITRDRKMKFDVFSHYSKILSNSDIPCCACCGENKFMVFLTIDHIIDKKNYDEPDLTNRKGTKRIMGKELYRYLQKNNFPLGYQVLCMNCNSAKSDSGICPHKTSIS